MASGAASSSPGASQPGATSSGASWLEFAVGSFNLGVDQKMLQGKPFERKHRDNFARVVANMVEEGTWTSCSDVRWVVLDRAADAR